MSTSVCDVCLNLLERITTILYPDYMQEIDLSEINLNLPPHLLHMKLIALAPVVRCSSCGVEDELCSPIMFEHLAYIKMFQTLPLAQTFRILREKFGYSRASLADYLGYDSHQSIYRFETGKTPIPPYVKKEIPKYFMHMAKMEYSKGKLWYFHDEDWRDDSIELTDNNAIIVPLPVLQSLIPENYADRKTAKVKFHAI